MFFGLALGADVNRTGTGWIVSIWKKMTINRCFLKWWYPQNTPKWSFLVGKPMVVGYHHFRKPPNQKSIYVNQDVPLKHSITTLSQFPWPLATCRNTLKAVFENMALKKKIFSQYFGRPGSWDTGSNFFLYMSTMDECQVLPIRLGGRNWQNRFLTKMGSLFCELNSRKMGFGALNSILSPKRTLSKESV